MSESERIREALALHARSLNALALVLELPAGVHDGHIETARPVVDAARKWLDLAESFPTDEDVEAAARELFEAEAGILPEDPEFGEWLSWADIDEIVRRDYRSKARRQLEAVKARRTGNGQ